MESLTDKIVDTQTQEINIFRELIATIEILAESILNHRERIESLEQTVREAQAEKRI